MSAFDETYERMKSATNARTQMELAEMLEIGQSSISDAKRRKSIPAEWFLRLHDKFGLNIDWLRGKDVPMYDVAAPQPRMPVEESSPLQQNRTSENGFGAMAPSVCAFTESGDNFLVALVREDAPALPSSKGVMLRVYETACDYEDGMSEPEFTVRDHILFPEFLIEKGTRVFVVDSDVMAPTLRKGAHVGVAKSHLVSGEVYAVLMPLEGVAFRRIVQDTESGMFVLSFDQPGLQSSRLSATTLQSRLLGKVIWTVQAF